MRYAVTGLIFVAGHEPPKAPVLLIVQSEAERMNISECSGRFAPMQRQHHG
jgi:hypothetical protein